MSMLSIPGKSVANVSGAMFFLLFPGFYFYHQVVAAGFFPRVFGGFFSPASVLAILLFFPFFGRVGRALSSSPGYFIIVFFFLLWSLLVAVLTSWSTPEDYVLGARYQYLNTVLAWGALFLIGVTINLELRWFRCLLWVSGVLMLFYLAFYIASTGAVRYQAAAIYDVEEGIASYQGFARSAMIVFFALLALSKSAKSQVLVFLGGGFVLFFLSARSEFFAFLFCFGLFCAVRSIRESSKALVVGWAVFFVFLAVIFFGVDISESRQLKVFDLSSDSSWSARGDLMHEALRRISEEPLLGQFGAYFERGGSGGYAHNIISAWDSFGFFGFLLFLFLVLVPASDSFGLALSSRRLSSFEIVYFFFSVSSLLLILVSKPIFWPVPALAWGMFFQRKKVDNEKNLRRGPGVQSLG